MTQENDDKLSDVKLINDKKLYLLVIHPRKMASTNMRTIGPELVGQNHGSDTHLQRYNDGRVCINTLVHTKHSMTLLLKFKAIVMREPV